MQDAILRRLGIPIAGWKVGASSPTAEPQAGPILADRLKPSPARFAMPADAFRTVEAELALRSAAICRRASQPYCEDEVWDAMAALHVGIEVLELSFIDRRKVSDHAVLGDLLNNGAFCSAPRSRLARPRCRDAGREHLDQRQRDSPRQSRHAGRPSQTLADLARQPRRGPGLPLRAGMIITTGSHTGMLDAPPGATVTARLDGIGEATLQFA